MKKKTLGNLIAIAICFCVISVVGCVKNTKPMPVAQGFINSYDQQIYATLYSTEVAINQAKVSFGADPKAKKTLNTTISAYNTALAAYLTWHGAAASNPDHASLDQAMAVLLGSIAAIQQQLQVTQQ